jgi:hypothetical protein
MKEIIKKVLKEAVGVPEGIYEAAVILYDEFSKNIDTKIKLDEDGEFEFNIPLSDPIQISDMTVNSAKIVLKFFSKDEEIETMLIAAGVGASDPKAMREVGKKIKLDLIPIENSIRIQIIFVVSEDKLNDLNKELKNFLTQPQNKNEIIQNFTHELKHLYDGVKNRTKDFEDLVNYQSSIRFIKDPSIPICGPMRQMFFLLYYFDVNENSVRASELYSIMKTNNITKEKFYDEFIKTDFYEKLSMARNFSKKSLVEELKNDYMGCVSDIYEMTEGPETKDDYQKIEYVLNKLPMVLGYVSSSTWQHIFHVYSSVLDKKGPFEKMMMLVFGTESEFDKLSVKYFSRYIQKLKNFEENPDRMYDVIEKKLKFASNKVTKKIVKVYSLLPSENEIKK